MAPPYILKDLLLKVSFHKEWHTFRGLVGSKPQWAWTVFTVTGEPAQYMRGDFHYMYIHLHTLLNVFRPLLLNLTATSLLMLLHSGNINGFKHIKSSLITKHINQIRLFVKALRLMFNVHLKIWIIHMVGRDMKNEQRSDQPSELSAVYL